ncbi:MAG TPA: transketolase [Rectinemataceae bacterium]|nr:transketolase [Rectinemataceae bacterium]
MNAARIGELKGIAREIRALTIDEIGYLGVGHIGGAMSVVELLTLLYYEHMVADPQRPRDPERDWLVLSKGHAGPALYATLAHKGFFPRDWLHTLNKGGTSLPSHCDRNLTPGVDMTTGSLGQGFSAAVGIALGLAMQGRPSRVFAVIGDGETDEGQVWEAAMFAAHHRLDKLVAFTDYNKQQLDGMTRDVLDLEDLDAKWRSFGWYTQRVDGHDLRALDEAVRKAKANEGRPSMIVMDTVKGKGCSFAEGLVSNHNMSYTMDDARAAIAALSAGNVAAGGRA